MNRTTSSDRRGSTGAMQFTPPQGIMAIIVSAVLFVIAAERAEAAPPAPPSNLQVQDVPNDAGTALRLNWTISTDDQPVQQPPRVLNYEILRIEDAVESATDAQSAAPPTPAPAAPGEPKSLGKVRAGTATFVDSQCRPQQAYRYFVRAIGPENESSAVITHPVAVRPVVAYFNADRTSFLVLLLAVCAAILLGILWAHRGQPLFIRRIAGLQAIPDAVGRATEMGRPILFVPGIRDVDEIDTIAGLTVLANVAEVAAGFDVPVEVPTAMPIVMTAAREACQAACLVAGHPETYDENNIYFVSSEQMGYVAATVGWIEREQPAACFLLGKFYAESLVLAEAGNAVGAIQVGGTAESSQLPFFVAACDYVLIGEELFAASAWLSKEPTHLGTLKGQDINKLMAVALLLMGCLLETAVSVAPTSTVAADWHRSFFANVLSQRK